MLFAVLARNAVRRYLEKLQNHLITVEDSLTEWRECFAAASAGGLLEAWLRDAERVPGAAPLEAVDEAPYLTYDMNLQWSSLEDQRAWAEETLRGVTTAAVDGSHMTVDVFDVQLGAVQVAWFINRHMPGGSFEKQVELYPILTEETDPGEARPASNYPLERWKAEMDRARRLVEGLAGQQPPSVVFVDGTIIPSFAELASDDERRSYIEASVELVATSKATRVPVVAYIDRSWARDLVDALAYISGKGNRSKLPPLSDPQVMAGILQRIGQRTAAFRCQRTGKVLQGFVYKGQDYSREVAFLYLRVSSGLPVRIEFPAWAVTAPPVPTRRGERKLVDYIAEITLAEAIVGEGYPWPLASADAAAALTAKDRAYFAQILQEEAEAFGIRLSTPRKAASKYHRRVW